MENDSKKNGVIELFRADGAPAAVWLCACCERVYTVLNEASECCMDEKTLNTEGRSAEKITAQTEARMAPLENGLKQAIREAERLLKDESPEPHRYPLWCFDHGEEHEESRYYGPFQTPDASNLPEAAELGVWRRCRQIRASEIRELRALLYNAPFDIFDDVPELIADVNSEAWFKYNLGVVDSGDNAIFWKRVANFLDENVTVYAYICEGDEQ